MRGLILPLSAAALLAGCTVGPNYAGPPAAAPRAAAGSGFVRAGNEQVTAAAPLAHWWESLRDPTLDSLIARALAANPNVAVLEARLRSARASLRLEHANELPSGSPSALYAHAHLPPIDLGQNGSGSKPSPIDLDLFNVGFDASWEIDLFGGHRRTVEAARANVEAARANLADAQVSLTAEVAQAYVNARDRQRRIALNARSVAMQEKILALTQQRYGRGTASAVDVKRLENQLESTRADVVPLNAELEAYLDALATLTGAEPGAVDAEMKAPAPVPLPPASVPVGDPAALLQRRPDIRAAERTLAAQTARIGVAEAARFPHLSIMGLIGIGGTSPSDLTDLDNFSAIIAPQLSWNFLDFGRGRARVDQAEAARDEALANYRKAVLAALRDAEDSLSRFRYRRIAVATLARAKAAADAVVALDRQRFDAGTVTLTDLLDAERQQIAAEQNLSIATAALTGDFIAIQKALGLGWSDAAPEPVGSRNVNPARTEERRPK